MIDTIKFQVEAAGVDGQSGWRRGSGGNDLFRKDPVGRVEKQAGDEINDDKNKGI